MRPVFSCILLVSMPATACAAEPFLNSGERIVFLGDSNTFAGHFIAQIDAVLAQKEPESDFKLLNLGLPSETCSGLSEPDHPFPRPNVHQRLDRVLDKSKPDVVVVCYGMNDGIYYPLDAERFAAYQRGIDRLITKVRGAGARVVLLTPPPFDPLPQRKAGKLRGDDAEKYAWFAIHEKYDDVIKRYARWIVSQQDRVDLMVDIHTPMADHLALQRKVDADYALSGDGVHFDRVGHRLVAEAILRAWGYPPATVSDELFDLADRRQTLLRDSWLTHTGHTRPGIKTGLPLSEAESNAADLMRRMRQ